MSLRITPSSTHPTSTTNTQTSKLNNTSQLSRGAPSAPGLPDTLRTSHNKSQMTLTPQVTSTHPLESRLASWQQTQSQLHHTLLRRNFGIALPLRMQMEQQMVRKSDGFRPSALGPPSQVHADILVGRDAEIAWEDVYAGQDGLRSIVDAGGDGQSVGWTDEMERHVGMGKW